MKPLMTLGALLGTCLFISAQDGGQQPPQRPQRQLPPEVIKEFDKDGDGKLSDEERTAMRDTMRAKMEEQRKATLEKYDADKDGKLNKEEAEKARTERQAELLKKYDKDGDGKLSDEERKAIPLSERGFGGPGGFGPGGRGGRGGRGGQGGAPGQDGKPGGDAKPTEKPADAPAKPADAPKAE
jgi:hypothetical protein